MNHRKFFLILLEALLVVATLYFAFRSLGGSTSALGLALICMAAAIVLALILWDPSAYPIGKRGFHPR